MSIKCKKLKTLTRGFTLIELSIVLVIIALLAGSVLVAQDMIENSKLTAVAEERAMLVSATKQFQDKYYSLPGDFKQASGLWGTLAPFVQYTIEGGTYPGDGDGRLDTFTFEEATFWHHLAIAGLMPLEYQGLSAVDELPAEPGKSIPRSQWKNDAGWIVRYLGARSSSPAYFDGDYGHIFVLVGTMTTIVMQKVLTVDQQQRLDKKFDDGEADEGKIRSFKSNDCVVGTAYNTSSTDMECLPLWITGF